MVVKTLTIHRGAKLPVQLGLFIIREGFHTKKIICFIIYFDIYQGQQHNMHRLSMTVEA